MRHKYTLIKSFYFELEDAQILIEVYKSQKVKNSISIQWTGENSLAVYAGKFVSLAYIQALLMKNMTSLKNSYRKQIDKVFLDAFSPSEMHEAKAELQEIARVFYKNIITPGYNSRPKSIQIRAQKTIWGSCSTSGTISLNVYLLKVPQALREYVFLHELIHMENPHHQRRFWKILEIYCPNAKLKRKELGKYILPK